ncbi:Fusaric acid resistance protein-like [Nocardioides scoriae]|uniref:Fusaric acid resistance protein-like n=1 Tax=Nocardioides scoriae TaxID=642780 RepID=A0A1H1NYC7_9ACTN|nr:FUSC family protein [Nocardioides scoriae]SDS03978.1 Fusaric acid resistance protein-like [Nocardioides scoriae]
MTAARPGWLHLGPRRPDDRRAAAQATVAVAGSLLVVLALGRTDWTSYAAFGAFAALYGRNQPTGRRLRRQLLGAALLTTCVTAGAAAGTLADREWWLVLGCGVVAALGSAIVVLEEWRPPGPLFLVFAFGAVASVAREPDQVPVALAVAAASAAYAVVVGLLSGLVVPQGPQPPRPAAPPGTRAQAGAPTPSAVPRGTTLYPALAAVSVVLSGAVSTGLGIGHPYWSMVAAVAVVTGRDRRHRWERAAHRIAGTLLGLVVAAALLLVVTDDVAVVVVVGVLQLLTELVVTRHYALALLAITPLALLMGQLAAPRPVGPLLLDRGVETVVGSLLGLAVALLGAALVARAGPLSRRTAPDAPRGR